MIRQLEELSLGAWPALQTILHDGWILRLANGYTRRSNSVSPLYPGSLPVEDRIDFCERLYREHKQPAIFKLTDAVEPHDLDARLASRGYAKEAPTIVMTAPLAFSDHSPSPRIGEFHTCANEWLSAYTTLNSVPQQHQPTLARIISTIPFPLCCATLMQDNLPLSCGMAVLQQHHVGLFDIVTHPAHRQKGLATELLHHLLDWSASKGATRAYLQVFSTNTPAQTLYRKLGFAPSHPYWYRIKP